mgnify:CR=1 FL=1
MMFKNEKSRLKLVRRHGFKSMFSTSEITANIKSNIFKGILSENGDSKACSPVIQILQEEISYFLLLAIFYIFEVNS